MSAKNTPVEILAQPTLAALGFAPEKPEPKLEAYQDAERATGVLTLQEELSRTKGINAELTEEVQFVRARRDQLVKTLEKAVLGYQVLRTMTIKADLNLAACVADEHLCEMRAALADCGCDE